MLDITVGLEKNVWNVDKWCQKLVSCPIMLCFVLRHMPTVGSKTFLKSHLNFHILLNFKFRESHNFFFKFYSQNIWIEDILWQFNIWCRNFLQQVIRLRAKSIGPKFPHVSVTQIILNIQGKTLQILKLNCLIDKAEEILVWYFCPHS